MMNHVNAWCLPKLVTHRTLTEESTFGRLAGSLALALAGTAAWFISDGTFWLPPLTLMGYL